MRVSAVECSSLVAVSVQNGTANPSQPILVKDGESFDFEWGESLFTTNDE